MQFRSEQVRSKWQISLPHMHRLGQVLRALHGLGHYLSVENLSPGTKELTRNKNVMGLIRVFSPG